MNEREGTPPVSPVSISDPVLRRMLYAIGVMGLIAFGFYTFSLLKGALLLFFHVLTPFVTALLVAYLLAPVVMWLQQRMRLGRILGTLALYVLIFLVTFILLGFLIPTILSEAVRLFDILKESVPPLLVRLSEKSPFRIDADLLHTIQVKIKAIEIDYEKLVGSLLPALRKVASGGFKAFEGATRSIFTGVGSVMGLFSFLVFVGVINFYLIVDWEKIPPLVKKMVPPKHRDRVFDVLDKIDVAMGGFLRGQITVAVIVGGLFAVGLFAIGLIGFPALRNYCVLIGTLAGVAGFIPYLGSVVGVTPALLIVLLTGGVSWTSKLSSLGGVLALFALIQAVEGFVLQPRIVGKGAGLHPLLVMFALILGAQFGIGGMIVAVPAAIVIRVLVREFYWLPLERREAQNNVEAGGA